MECAWQDVETDGVELVGLQPLSPRISTIALRRLVGASAHGDCTASATSPRKPGSPCRSCSSPGHRPRTGWMAVRLIFDGAEIIEWQHDPPAGGGRSFRLEYRKPRVFTLDLLNDHSPSLPLVCRSRSMTPDPDCVT